MAISIEAKPSDRQLARAVEHFMAIGRAQFELAQDGKDATRNIAEALVAAKSGSPAQQKHTPGDGS